MFFLLRIAFWVTLVLALLPSGSGMPSGAQAKVGASDAVAAAGAAIADMSNFCERQPDACVVGAQAAVVVGQRAQAGARLVYDFINDHAIRGNEQVANVGGDKGASGDKTGSVTLRKLVAVGAVPTSQNTLSASDLEPVWQAPPARAEAVPLPRPRPHKDPQRKA